MHWHGWMMVPIVAPLVVLVVAMLVVMVRGGDGY